MRMICNLGLRYHMRHEKPSFQGSVDDWQSEAQEAFNLRREEGVIQCQLCGLSLEEMESLVDEGVQVGKPWFSRCLAFLCPVCSQSETNRENFCPRKPTCCIAAVTTGTSFSELSMSIPSFSHELPSKVAMLLCDLRKQSPQTKCVVFSSWRTTLNVIQANLDHESIPCLRFDGTVTQKERHSVIERFCNDPQIRVVLLTLTCGAVGLTLTEASRAHLMEPSWNPTLEDQALARIHRIGQTQEVTTLRMFVQNSFEEVRLWKLLTI
ncbi:SNF2 family N-terminal domain-containing protein [Fusarium acuminatum]|uniref:SNF2 family N-terminal domain-containing protein n=1 Tax=Fusarium acuminatum TaxID=5515 RepID=A0ABZ2X6T6_9HYPO